MELSYAISIGSEEALDLFVSTEPEIKVDDESGSVLHERILTADPEHLIPAREARLRIQQWLSRSPTTKTR
jgi:hypothetical protein